LQIDQKSVDGKAILFELRFSQPWVLGSHCSEMKILKP
jgi:hypothetical protein